MIAVVQRVSEASVTVEEADHREAIGPGLCVLLGVERGDGEAEADWMAGKIARLRIFRDDEGRMNRSVQDIGGAVLVVSQFTLAGDCRKGNRPSFVNAADPAEGERLYELCCALIERGHGLAVRKGVFGAMMQVSIVNDGPVTLIVQRPPGPRNSQPARGDRA
ncbi:MAG: D-aminoacyl-tRNA deacylase [Planctomycetota bacterium]|nr:D-aminoacyl-tRNA deacylase [Planctomycetota bacterium]